MSNQYRWNYEKQTIGLTGQESLLTDGTDIIIGSGNQTPSSAGSITLVTISVPAGSYCVIGDVDFFTSASAGGVLEMSYTLPLTTQTVNRYLPLAAAGLISSQHDFREKPFAAVFNPINATSPLSITFAVTATASDQYIANVAYVLRFPSL